MSCRAQIVFYDFDRLSADDKAFHFWFHTGFVYNNYLLLHKDVIDRACKDKGVEFDADFKVSRRHEREARCRRLSAPACDVGAATLSHP